MNKIFSTFILAGIAPWSAQAAEVKKRIYREEATQNLQVKLNTISSEKDIATIEMLTAIDNLLTEGADPNIAPEGNKEQPLVVLLFTVLDINKNIPSAIVENIIKKAVDKGAHLDLKGEKGDKLLRFIITTGGSPAMVKLAIDYGADSTYKNTNFGKTPLMSIEQGIQNSKDAIKRMQEVDIPMHQKGVERFETIRDILKAAEQKK